MPNTPSLLTRRFALYVRKSTEEDERQTQSLESQKSRALELAERSGCSITHVLEESRSAKEPGRPEFGRLLALIDAGEIDGILAWHPDRLSRNEMDAAALTMRLRKGVLHDLLFVEYFFHNSPEGIMMLQMALSQSQYQVSKLSIDVTRGIQDKLKKGWYPHRAPLGYVNNKHMDKGEKTISPDGQRFAMLQKVWKLLLTGAYGGGDILRALNGWGFRTPVTPKGRGGEPLSHSTLYRLFGNLFYAGHFVHNGQVYQGAHEPMVTLEEFIRAQSLLGREVEMQERYPSLLPKRLPTRGEGQPYQGLMRCGHCGAQITSTTTVKPSGKAYTYYHCGQGRGACGKKCVRAERIEAMIDAELAKMDVLPEFYEWGLEEIARSTQEEREAQDAVQAQRQRALQETEKQLDALTDMKLRDLLTDEEYRSRKRKLTLERARLNEEVQACQQSADDVRASCLNALEYMKNAREWLKCGDVSLKRVVARNLGSNFVLKDGTLILEPHPMLAPVLEAYPTLVAKYEQFKLVKITSLSIKKKALEPLRTTWSGIWDTVQTLANMPGCLFPNVAVSALTVQSKLRTNLS